MNLITKEKNDSKSDEFCQDLLSGSCNECIENGCVRCGGPGDSSCRSTIDGIPECSDVCEPQIPGQDTVLTTNSIVQHHVRMESLS